MQCRGRKGGKPELGKPEHVICKLLDGLLHRLGATVNNVDSKISRVLDLLLHIAAKPGEVGGHRGNSHQGAFSWCVAPESERIKKVKHAVVVAVIIFVGVPTRVRSKRERRQGGNHEQSRRNRDSEAGSSKRGIRDGRSP